MQENITDNMVLDGYAGIWYSYISDMQMFRVQLLNGVTKIFRVSDNIMTLAEDAMAEYVERQVEV